jgi:hypothetical protein
MGRSVLGVPKLDKLQKNHTFVKNNSKYGPLISSGRLLAHPGAVGRSDWFCCSYDGADPFHGREKKKDPGSPKGGEFRMRHRGQRECQVSVRYFLIAILFVLFDVEIIFFYPWAVNFKETGWEGYLEMMVFLAFLLVGFYYIFKKGAFEWKER